MASRRKGDGAWMEAEEESIDAKMGGGYCEGGFGRADCHLEQRYQRKECHCIVTHKQSAIGDMFSRVDCTVSACNLVRKMRPRCGHCGENMASFILGVRHRVPKPFDRQPDECRHLRLLRLGSGVHPGLESLAK